MTSAIRRVLEAACSRQAAPDWVQRHAAIAGERRAIEAMLAARPASTVYGFTTLLGQLDGAGLQAGDQDRLLQGHLVGEVGEIRPPMPALMLAMKIEQLAHGGSGIHPDTYGLLLGHCSDPAISVRGAWHASYGSADVVPGAWWLRALQAQTAGLPLQRGDLIALISGNFVSTAFALASSLQLIDYLSRFLAQAAVHADAVAAGVSAASRTWLYRAWMESAAALSPAKPRPERQRPVSLRDLSMYVSPAAKIIDELRDALEFRLSGCTSNPLFASLPPTGVAAWSQSGFVDLRLSMTLTSAIQLVLFCMGAVQRFVQHYCDARRVLPADEFIPYVQSPKVASAYLAQARLAHGALASGFSLAESEGIEDICDMSLALAHALTDVIRSARQQEGVLTALTEGGTEPLLSGRFFEMMADRFGGGSDHGCADMLATLSGQLC